MYGQVGNSLPMSGQVNIMTDPSMVGATAVPVSSMEAGVEQRVSFSTLAAVANMMTTGNNPSPCGSPLPPPRTPTLTPRSSSVGALVLPPARSAPGTPVRRQRSQNAVFHQQSSGSSSQSTPTPTLQPRHVGMKVPLPPPNWHGHTGLQSPLICVNLPLSLLSLSLTVSLFSHHGLLSGVALARDPNLPPFLI